MRKYLIPVLAAAVIFGATGAYAASASGTIKSMDSQNHTITLDNGQVYHLPATENMSQFKVGEKVNITFETHGQQHVASSVKMSK